MLKNYTEIATLQLLDYVLDNYKKTHPNLCDCERCRQDIMAIALNHLPPHYVVTDTGKVITQISFDHFGGKAQVISQIVNAVEIVMNNPRHEK
ncbi:late competence development ComFB family protein [Peptococcaceae bacterium 1198_IL3148]